MKEPPWMAAMLLEVIDMCRRQGAEAERARIESEVSVVPCQHRPHEVVADVLEGDAGGYAVSHCRACGAVRVSYEGPDGKGYVKPWERPTNRIGAATPRRTVPAHDGATDAQRSAALPEQRQRGRRPC